LQAGHIDPECEITVTDLCRTDPVRRIGHDPMALDNGTPVDFAGLSLSAGGGHQRYSGQPHQVLPARKFEIKTAKHRKKFTIGG
jgi:hypothetical protein